MTASRSTSRAAETARIRTCSSPSTARGKKSRVPKAVADEIARAERARESLYETVDALLKRP